MVYSQMDLFSLKWNRGKDIPIDRLKWASSVVLNGMVYCGSNILGNVVIQYDLESGDWREIPTPLEAFALASFNNQLVLAGGGDSDSIEDSTIRVWDSERGAVVD